MENRCRHGFRAGMFLVATWIGAGCWFATNVCACDTTIRQQAFEDERDEHRLVVVTDDDAPSSSSAYLRLQEWMRGPGADFNAKLDWIGADEADRPEEPATVLIGLGRMDGLREFLIDHWLPAPTDEDLEILLDSPVRKRIRHNLGAYWAVLLHAPADGEPNEEIDAILDQTVEEWSESNPPGIVVEKLDRNDPKERILVSFAGIDPGDPDWVGIIFGRGKLMAPPMIGDEIALGNLDDLLSQVLEACTCLRPPSSMGVDIPMTWEPELEDEILNLMVYTEEAPPQAVLVEDEEEQEIEELLKEPEQSIFNLTLGVLFVSVIAAVLGTIFVIRRERRRNAPPPQS